MAEVALALVALVGAGLFILSFRSGMSAPLGFDPTNVSVARIHVTGDRYSPDQQIRFLDRLKERLSQMPGYEMAAYADTIPLGFGLGPAVTATPEGYVPAPGENMAIARSVVGTDYFSLLRMPLVEGRDFRDSDDASADPVVIVNQEYARRYLGVSTAILGRKIKAWKGQMFTIVGVVRDGKYYLPQEQARPFLFAALRQVNTDPTGMGFGFYLRSKNAESADQALSGLRREVNALDPNAVMFDAVLLTSYIHAPLFPQRIAASLLSVLGGFSLLLAALGLYSVMAYTVSQRTAEIGLRVALGAMPGDVLKTMMGQGLLLTLVGVLTGLVLARAAVIVIENLPLAVSPAGVALYTGAASFLTVIAAVAIYVPARRASRIDPSTALRAE